MEESVPRAVARGLYALGVVGAILLLLAGIVAGAGELNSASVLQSAVNCAPNCGGSGTSAISSLTMAEELFGVSIALGGAGTALVLVACLRMMRGGAVPPGQNTDSSRTATGGSLP